MATARLALASVLDTVSSTANSVTQLIGVTTKGIGMLDAAVTKAANEQRKNHVSAALLFDEQLQLEYATSVTTMKIKSDDFAQQSERHAELFNAAYAEIKSALNPQPKPSA